MAGRGRASASRFNRFFTFERSADFGDGVGGQEENWRQIGEGWAEATLIGGKEALLAGTLRTSQGWRLETWFRDDVTMEDRIAGDWLPKFHRINIESIADPDGRRERIVILGTASKAFDKFDPIPPNH